MSSPRKSSVAIFYNGKNIVKDLADCQKSFTYTDNASGSSDSISVDISDPTGKWLGAWMPNKGDTLSAQITVENWVQEGDRKTLNCGKFTLDDVSLSGGVGGNSVSVGAVSAPANTGFTDTKNSRTWEYTTIKQIAQGIANSNGVTLVYDAKNIHIESAEQSTEADSSFLLNLCEEYGLSMKVYSKKIVIFDREVYKAKAAVKTIERKDVRSWSYNTSLIGSYTGGTLTYSDEDGNEFEVTVGTKERLLNVNTSVSSTADAELKLNAALNKENHSTTTMTIEIMGDVGLVASQCILLKGWSSKLDGKYYIDSVTHSLSSGYKCSYKLSKCDPSSAFGVISEAINKLASLGIITNRDWWLDNYSKIENADVFIMAVGGKLNKRPTGEAQADALNALIILWRNNIISILNVLTLRIAARQSEELNTLIIRAAMAV